MVPLDFFQRGNTDYLERLQAQFKRDPQSVDPEWRAFFSGFEAGSAAGAPTTSLASQDGQPVDRLAESVADLVHSYRELGHCIAKLDPLGHAPCSQPLLALSEFSLREDGAARPVTLPHFTSSRYSLADPPLYTGAFTFRRGDVASGWSYWSSRR